MSYVSCRLTAEHDAADFDCGNATLNVWLKEHAQRAERAGVSATTVWTHPGHPRVLAYRSISPTLLRREELPSRSMAGGYGSVPGYLLGRLALGVELHRQRLGTQILLDALEVIVAAAERGGGRVIVVEAIDDAAAAFYQHHDFVRVGESRRLFMKVATARAVLH